MILIDYDCQECGSPEQIEVDLRQKTIDPEGCQDDEGCGSDFDIPYILGLAEEKFYEENPCKDPWHGLDAGHCCCLECSP